MVLLIRVDQAVPITDRNHCQTHDHIRREMPTVTTQQILHKLLTNLKYDNFSPHQHAVRIKAWGSEAVLI